jgi:uncharacterized protein YndB with AHSA1/START domain
VADAAAEGIYTQDVRIDADPDVVFDFLVDGDQMVRWMGVSAKLEPIPGGPFRIDVNGSDIAIGQFLEVNRPHRVLLTWGWEGSEVMPPGSTEIEITLVAEDAGTLLRFEHRLVPADQVARHTEGWNHYLARLATAAAGGEPGPSQLGHE